MDNFHKTIDDKIKNTDIPNKVYIYTYIAKFRKNKKFKKCNLAEEGQH